ncbi:MAG: methyltransferase [Bdellovibrionales bacterium RIFCSPHIGHO2_01_FULL_40_29]|nr:MAG: methyltransferase [Bdellovibrionales bacterium RIFCSPHIGHO2_01_FULL_40_29]OFZ33970.1 MAG: methyltransferase [Bdellovibrionales bacterium RIFCSPHIGHO2_02_FULL_40_15]
MLTLVATPIGRQDEITLRALDVLKNADVVICESTKETSTLLKHLGIKAKRYEILDEHSTKEDLEALVLLCETQNVCLVSDCGTPAFCDPGNNLIALCRKKNIQIQSALGASALMGLLSLSSERLQRFHFIGFLPAETIQREKEWQMVKKNREPFIVMDTPYRLKKMIEECKTHLPDRRMLLALNLSQDNETILEGTPKTIQSKIPFEKAEFMILVYSA